MKEGIFSNQIFSSSAFSAAYYTGEEKDSIFVPNTYEPIARVDFSMSDADTGDVLRCSKSSPNVHLDWSLFSGSGNFLVRRGTIGDFSSYSNIFGPSALKTYDDPVLEDTTSYWYDNKNRSLTDTLYFYHADHLGTPIAMTDSSGTLVWRAEHTPFGSIYALVVGTISNNLRFPGQYFDSETGLAQNWFRDYDAKIGRYREVDPILNKINRANVLRRIPGVYNYSSNCPTRNTDPLGLWKVGESCKCKTPSPEDAAKKACSEDTITKLPAKYQNCVREKCKSLKIECGGWFCRQQGGEGWSIPVFGLTIHLCNPAFGNPCGLANTVLHEILHKCWATDFGGPDDASVIANACIPNEPPC